MAAVGCNDTQADFVADLKDTHKPRSSEGETEYGHRMAAVLVFLPHARVLDMFLLFVRAASPSSGPVLD